MVFSLLGTVLPLVRDFKVSNRLKKTIANVTVIGEDVPNINTALDLVSDGIFDGNQRGLVRTYNYAGNNLNASLAANTFATNSASVGAVNKLYISTLGDSKNDLITLEQFDVIYIADRNEKSLFRLTKKPEIKNDHVELDVEPVLEGYATFDASSVTPPPPQGPSPPTPPQDRYFLGIKPSNTLILPKGEYNENLVITGSDSLVNYNDGVPGIELVGDLRPVAGLSYINGGKNTLSDRIRDKNILTSYTNFPGFGSNNADVAVTLVNSSVTVTMSNPPGGGVVTNPDFGQAGIVVGDKVNLCGEFLPFGPGFCFSASIVGEVASVSGNVITLTEQPLLPVPGFAPGQILPTPFARLTSITVCPNVVIQSNEILNTISVSNSSLYMRGIWVRHLGQVSNVTGNGGFGAAIFASNNSNLWLSNCVVDTSSNLIAAFSGEGNYISLWLFGNSNMEGRDSTFQNVRAHNTFAATSVGILLGSSSTAGEGHYYATGALSAGVSVESECGFNGNVLNTASCRNGIISFSSSSGIETINLIECNNSGILSSDNSNVNVVKSQFRITGSPINSSSLLSGISVVKDSKFTNGKNEPDLTVNNGNSVISGFRNVIVAQSGSSVVVSNPLNGSVNNAIPGPPAINREYITIDKSTLYALNLVGRENYNVVYDSNDVLDNAFETHELDGVVDVTMDLGETYKVRGTVPTGLKVYNGKTYRIYSNAINPTLTLSNGTFNNGNSVATFDGTDSYLELTVIDSLAKVNAAVNVTFS